MQENEDAKVRLAFAYIAAMVVGIVVSIVQFFAIWDWFDVSLDWHVAFDIVASLSLAFLPLGGALLAGYAAVTLWGWSWYAAAALFSLTVVPFVLLFLAQKQIRTQLSIPFSFFVR